MAAIRHAEPIAGGWHTCAVMTRLYADHYVSKVASLTSLASTSCAR
ncbi:hypothetical protein ABZT04_42350 [Streptomyces sp. NPDC005492]